MDQSKRNSKGIVDRLQADMHLSALLKYIRRLISLSPPVSRPISLETSAFGRIPLELIKYIASFLPPESAAAFSISSLTIYSILGTQYLTALENGEKHDRYNFLKLIEPRFPMHIVCYYCKKLHAMKKAHGYIYHKGRSSWDLDRSVPCWEAQLKSDTASKIHEDFAFTVFFMAMKAYRRGLDYSTLLGQLSYKTRTRSDYGFNKQSTALARIVDGSLLIRHQTIFMIPTARRTFIPRDLHLQICPHVYLYSSRGRDEYMENIRAGWWLSQSDLQARDGISKCHRCLTDFRIDFKSFGEQGNTLFVTKWQDLGQGRSPLDQKFQSHIECWHKELNKPQWCRVESPPGFIYATFQRQAGVDFEFDGLLTPQDRKKLFKRRSHDPPWLDSLSSEQRPITHLLMRSTVARRSHVDYPLFALDVPACT